MKIGVSSYSFHQAVSAGRMSTYDIVDAAAKLGFEALDFAVLLGDDPIPEMCAKLGRQARDAGLPVKNYAVSADFLANDVDAEVEKTCREVDNAVLLGAQTFRHDVTWTQPRQGAAFTFESVLPRLAEGCRRVTEYAAQRGIRTMVENHGQFVQDSARVLALIDAVGHENFGALVDMGNFMCADENSAVALGNVLPYAAHIHAKDFIFKSGDGENPGEGFFGTRAGNYLRGTIVGHGVVPVAQCLKLIKRAGYEGWLSLEFEGMEDCITGCRVGLANLRRLCGGIGL